MARAVRAEDLAGVGMFAFLDADSLVSVAAGARTVKVAARKTVFEEGDDGRSLYVVRSGRVELVRTAADGSVIVLNACGPGDHFGELAVLDPAPRSATAVATEPTELIEIGKPVVDALLDEVPYYARWMLGYLARSMTKAKENVTRELHYSQRETIVLLAQAAEFGDEDTGLHINRMAQFCARLGLATGMSSADADVLLNAAMLHDIGKFGIPHEILRKPGKFTDEEYAVMRRHPLIGALILDRGWSPIARLGRQIALAHHERWDGRGYPEGLKGEAIPLEARIASLCDVFDALTSRRPYKEAWPVDRAVDQLRTEAGTAFDADLVRLFEQVLPDILAIRQEFSAGE